MCVFDGGDCTGEPETLYAPPPKPCSLAMLPRLTMLASINIPFVGAFIIGCLRTFLDWDLLGICVSISSKSGLVLNLLASVLVSW